MELYEIIPLLNNLHLKAKNEWEQARMIAFVQAQSQSTKKLNMADFLPFPWEQNNENKEDGSIDWDEIKQMQMEIKQREIELNTSNGKE